MRYAGIFAAAAVLALLLVPALSVDTDAIATIDRDDVTWEFDDRSGGSITFTIDNSGGRFTMDVEVYEGSTLVGSLSDVTVPAGAVDFEVTVEMGDFTEVGSHTLRVVITTDPSDQFPSGQDTMTLQVTVDQSLLSNWVTYAVIIVVVIIVVIFVYLKVRDSPKKKSEMTFEQLEEERKAEMAAKSERKKAKSSSGPSTERQMYLAKKKKQEKE